MTESKPPISNKTKDIIKGYALDNSKIGRLPMLEDLKNSLIDILISEFLEKEHKGWSTGFKEFDTATNGMSPMTVIAGSPGSGKSTTTRWMALNFLKTNPNNRVLFLTAEDGKRDFIKILKSLILSINKDIFDCDFKKLFPHLNYNSFSEFLLDKTLKVAKEKPEIYAEYVSLINRLEYKNGDSGSGVFEDKQAFVHTIIDTLLGYSNPHDTGEPINELLVVLDHLGEFKFIQGDNEYERLNDIMESIMTMALGFTTKVKDEMEQNNIIKNPFVYNIRERILGEDGQKRFEELSARLKEKYSILVESSGEDWDDFYEDVINDCNVPRVKFLLLSQFKTDAYKSGNYQKKTYELNSSDLESSKRLGQKSPQIFFVWKEFIPKGVGVHFDTRNINLYKEQLRNFVNPLPEISYIFCEKGRASISHFIYPCITNLATGTIIPIQVHTECAKGLLYKSNIEDFRKSIGIEFEKPSSGSKGDTFDTWQSRYKSVLKSIATGSRIIDPNSFSIYQEKMAEQKKFFKAFELEELYTF